MSLRDALIKKKIGIISSQYSQMYSILTKIEFIAFLIIVLCSLFIFYKTYKIHNLTQHKGIGYFRKGFLFLGFSYLTKLITIIFYPTIISVIINNGIIDRKLLFIISSIFYLIGMSYLIASIHHKKIKEYMIYLINIVISIVSIYFLGIEIIGTYGLVLLIILGTTSFEKYNKTKNKKVFSQIYLIYISMSIFWVFLAFVQDSANTLKYSRFYIAIATSIFFIYLSYLVQKELSYKNHKKRNQEEKKIINNNKENNNKLKDKKNNKNLNI